MLQRIRDDMPKSAILTLLNLGEGPISSADPHNVCGHVVVLLLAGFFSLQGVIT